MTNCKSLYGLVGYPLGHSFSRAFFSKKFAEEGISAEYLNFELPSIDLLPQILNENPQLQGLNVTIPYKQAIIPFLTELSDEAKSIGAVNVIRVCRIDNTLHLKGFNSDVTGFVESIRPLIRPHHKKALVLGTGGASKAVCRGLEKLGLKWRYVSRTPRTDALTYSDLTAEIISDFTVIINCSPLGTHPNVNSCPDIPYEALTEQHLLYDLVYNPGTTLFMKHGLQYGATVKNGLEMLHLQAIASWDFWTEESNDK